MAGRWIVGILILALAGCGGAPEGNSAIPKVETPTPSPIPPLDAPLSTWLVDHWAYGDDCASDFGVTYGADGKVEANGDFGSWQAAGNEVTETITQRMSQEGEEGEDSETLDPPDVIRYTVERVDGEHALLRRGDKSQPIRRC
ncbi:hypothetical protein [Sphingomonas sp.]|uniref:hypothetical protein n=1 Tax=Sphingomonas sp. TaxID=28214 RepID=UPI001B14BA35|nr:hypothetical protein [Sphingomonas sp.]MBO9712404.1 hypothetical protein [Sphingomonas sp.]